MDAVSKAQLSGSNSGESKKKHSFGPGNPHRWKPGQSGNPKGRPKKQLTDMVYAKILNSPENRKAIEESVKKIVTGGRMASVLMLREMAERVEGKVEQSVNVNAEVNISLAEVIQERRKAISE